MWKLSKKKVLKIALLLVFLTAIVSFFAFDLKQYITLEYAKEQRNLLASYYKDNTFLTILIFMLIYIAVTSLSLPGAAIMTISAGAFFDPITGVIIVSFASTIGATIAFLIARFLLRDYIQDKYREKLKPINEGFEKEGAFYLFALRLVPAFPFFIINILMSLTPIRTITFFFASQVGMIPAIIIYVYAGAEIGKIESLSDIASSNLIIAFILLGIFPLLAKRLVEFMRRRNV